MKILISLAFCLFVVASSFAQNQSINYKAVIKDSNGNLVANQTIDVRFNIFEGAISLLEEVHTVTTDANGIVILNIGEGTIVNGDFSAINWSNTPHSLATELDLEQDGTFIYLGSTSFKSVPYALHAKSVAPESIKIDDLEDAKSDSDNEFSSIFLGEDVGLNDDGNNANIGIGYRALQSITNGTGNISIGVDSGRSNISGERNIAIGINAKSGAFGNNNISIGESSGYIVDDDYSNCIFIGTDAGKGTSNSGSNKLYIETSGSSTPLIYGEFDNDILGFNGDVAIGHQTPLAPLHIKKNGDVDTQTIVAVLESATSNRPTLLFSETANLTQNVGMSLEYNGHSSINKMIFNSTQNNPLFEFKNSGDFKILDGDLTVDGLTTARNTISTEPDLVLGGNTSSADNGFIVSDPQFPSSDIIIQSNDAVSIQLDTDNDENGQFEIRAGDGTEIFEVNESGNVKVNGALVHSSDRRLKKDIQDLPYGLNEILQLQPKSYNWKNREEEYKSLGLIAQEVQLIIKEIVTAKNDDIKTLGISYTELIPVLINAIKEQAQEMEDLKAQVKSLKTTQVERVERLEARLASLEN